MHQEVNILETLINVKNLLLLVTFHIRNISTKGKTLFNNWCKLKTTIQPDVKTEMQ